MGFNCNTLDSKQRRLVFYKETLSDYQNSNIFIVGWIYRLYLYLISNGVGVSQGLCAYFKSVQYIDFYNTSDFKRLFPELYSTKPKNTTYGYWFEKGKLESRIKCLQEAIKIIEEDENGMDKIRG